MTIDLIFALPLLILACLLAAFTQGALALLPHLIRTGRDQYLEGMSWLRLGGFCLVSLPMVIGVLLLAPYDEFLMETFFPPFLQGHGVLLLLGLVCGPVVKRFNWPAVRPLTRASMLVALAISGVASFGIGVGVREQQRQMMDWKWQNIEWSDDVPQNVRDAFESSIEAQK
jgi:hypothetical protein